MSDQFGLPLFEPRPVEQSAEVIRTFLGVPDPPSLLCSALKHHVAHLRCEVVVHTPTSLSSSFDEFGRPIPGDWGKCTIEIPNLESSVHQAANPQSQAEPLTSSKMPAKR